MRWLLTPMPVALLQLMLCAAAPPSPATAELAPDPPAERPNDVSPAAGAESDDPVVVARTDSGDDAVHEVDEILVSDQTLRPAELFQETPVETEILTEEILESLPANNAVEAIEGLPGIRIQRRLQGEEGAVSIEGMPPSYTMILVNGQRYSGEFGGVDDLREIPISNVERIEIKRGAQGLRYGPEAGGGVINIVTKDPPSEGWSVEAGGGGGNDSRALLNATPAVGWDDYGLSLTYDLDQIGGFDSPDDVEGRTVIPSGEESRRLSHDLYGTFRWTPLVPLTATTRLGWRDRDERFVFEGSDDDDPKRSRVYRRLLASQDFGWDVGEASRLSGAVTYLNGRTESDVGRNFVMKEDELRLQLALEHFFELGPLGNNFTLGGDLRRTTLDVTQDEFVLEDEDGVGTTLASDVSDRFNHGGIFLIGETEIASWLTAELGARGQFHTLTDPKLLPHVALMITPWRSGDGRSARIRLSAGRNYRIPTLREFYQPPVAQVGGSYFLAGNPDLEPEEARSYRVGVEANPVRWLSVSVSGFWNDIQNHIRSSPSEEITLRYELGDPPDTSPGSACDPLSTTPPPPGTCDPAILPITATVFQKTNLDDVLTRGGEVRLHLLPHPTFDFQVGYTYLRTKVEDSNIDTDELPNEPRHTVDARLTLTAPRVDTRLTVRTRWRSEALMETSGTGLLSFCCAGRSDPSTTVDLRLLQPLGPVHPRLQGLTVYTDLFNVTDNRFIDSYVVRGRTFLVGMTARFD